MLSKGPLCIAVFLLNTWCLRYSRLTETCLFWAYLYRSFRGLLHTPRAPRKFERCQRLRLKRSLVYLNFEYCLNKSVRFTVNLSATGRRDLLNLNRIIGAGTTKARTVNRADEGLSILLAVFCGIKCVECPCRSHPVLFSSVSQSVIHMWRTS